MCPCPTNMHQMWSRDGALPSQPFLKEHTLPCTDSVIATLPSTSCFPHVSYTSLLIVLLELAWHPVLLRKGVQHQLDFKDSHSKTKRDEKYLIESEKSGSCSLVFSEHTTSPQQTRSLQDSTVYTTIHIGLA